MNYLLTYFSPLIISYFTQIKTENVHIFWAGRISQLMTSHTKTPIIESELTLKLHRVYVSCYLYLYMN